MTTNALTLKIEALERQLVELKMEAAGQKEEQPSPTRAHLYGIFAGQPDLTMEDFEAVKIQPKLDWLEEPEAA